MPLTWVGFACSAVVCETMRGYQKRRTARKSTTCAFFSGLRCRQCCTALQKAPERCTGCYAPLCTACFYYSMVYCGGCSRPFCRTCCKECPACKDFVGDDGTVMQAHALYCSRCRRDMETCNACHRTLCPFTKKMVVRPDETTAMRCAFCSARLS